MFKIANKLKNNIKNIRDNRLDIIEELLSLVILFMPFMISIFSIVKFYIVNKVSLEFSDKAVNTYLNGPFWIAYICLILLAIIISFIKYYKNEGNLLKNKVTIMIICSTIIFIITLLLIFDDAKIINVNQNLIKLLTFNKGANTTTYSIYMLLFLLIIMALIIKIAKKEYKDEFLLIIISMGISLMVLPLAIWFASNIIYFIILIIFQIWMLLSCHERD